MDLHKQGVFAQAPTQEEGSDVMSCFFHGLQNVKGTKLEPEKKTQGEIHYKKSKETSLSAEDTKTHSKGLDGG